MKKKEKKERSAERINQFIIECMFSKYFEEQEHSSKAVKPEEIAIG